MGFLSGPSAVTRNDQINRGQPTGLATATAEECHAPDARALGFVQRRDDVGRVSAGGDDDHEVARLSESGDLPGEHLLKTVVVSNARRELTVCAERDRGQRAAVLEVAPGQLRRKMGGFGGTASVAADQQLPTIPQGFDDQFARPVDLRADLRDRLQGLDGLGEGGVEGHATEE